MRITNTHGLPQSLVRALENDPYSKGYSDFSVTQLLNPPRAEALKLKHKDDLVEDASDRIFSLLGQSTHAILERAARPDLDLVERRFYGKFLDYTLSGQIDLLEKDTETLSDFKVTKAYAFSTKGGSGQKPEWIQQLNMQLELLRLSGLDAKKLQIVGILRDFDQKCLDPKNRLKFMAGYPKNEIVSVEIPIWPREKTIEFIEGRIRAHVEARTVLPKCTSQETWGGNRCAQYCSVASFCSQYQSSLKTGLIEGVKDAVSKETNGVEAGW